MGLFNLFQSHRRGAKKGPFGFLRSLKVAREQTVVLGIRAGQEIPDTGITAEPGFPLNMLALYPHRRLGDGKHLFLLLVTPVSILREFRERFCTIATKSGIIGVFPLTDQTLPFCRLPMLMALFHPRFSVQPCLPPPTILALDYLASHRLSPPVFLEDSSPRT